MKAPGDQERTAGASRPRGVLGWPFVGGGKDGAGTRAGDQVGGDAPAGRLETSLALSAAKNSITLWARFADAAWASQGIQRLQECARLTHGAGGEAISGRLAEVELVLLSASLASPDDDSPAKEAQRQALKLELFEFLTGAFETGGEVFRDTPAAGVSRSGPIPPSAEFADDFADTLRAFQGSEEPRQEREPATIVPLARHPDATPGEDDQREGLALDEGPTPPAFPSDALPKTPDPVFPVAPNLPPATDSATRRADAGFPGEQARPAPEAARLQPPPDLMPQGVERALPAAALWPPGGPPDEFEAEPTANAEAEDPLAPPPSLPTRELARDPEPLQGQLELSPRVEAALPPSPTEPFTTPQAKRARSRPEEAEPRDVKRALKQICLSAAPGLLLCLLISNAVPVLMSENTPILVILGFAMSLAFLIIANRGDDTSRRLLGFRLPTLIRVYAVAGFAAVAAASVWSAANHPGNGEGFYLGLTLAGLLVGLGGIISLIRGVDLRWLVLSGSLAGLAGIYACLSLVL